MTELPFNNGYKLWPRIEPLPGQLELFPDRPEPFPLRTNPPARDGQTLLFDTGADLPGAKEREQRIFWDV